MRETIYTIPLTEALEQDTQCPFCYLEKRLEEEQIKYALGPAMMEPDHRVRSNALGYCHRHTQKMAEAQQALPFALVMDTRMDTVLSALKDIEADIKAPKGFLKKSKRPQVSERVKNLTTTCLVCDKIENTMSKFLYTFWYLYKKEPDFKKRVLESRGFCLPHFQAVLAAREEQSGVKSSMIEELFALELETLSRCKEDVSAFIKQFDYRSSKENGEIVKNAHQICGGKLSKF